MKKQIAALLLSPLALTIACAANVPAAMTFDGKPIDSLCFDMTERMNTIDLKNCGAKQNNVEILKEENDTLNKKGFTGYSWKDSSTPASSGFSYYKAFPAKNNSYWIYTINNGGGSGEFTNLFLAKRIDANTLQIKDIAGGDRCNGGIQDVSVKNHTLIFSINLTSSDLYDLGTTKPSRMKPYDDLAACAVCCVAKGFYTTKDTDIKFMHATLNTTNISELPEQGKYAACFNKLLSTQSKTLSKEKITAFAAKFNQTCVN